jgi:hypothetical protein
MSLSVKQANERALSASKIKFNIFSECIDPHKKCGFLVVKYIYMFLVIQLFLHLGRLN